jgi:hypothetical protein
MKRANAIDYNVWQPLTHWHWPFPVPSRLHHGIRVAPRPPLPKRDDAFFQWAFSGPEIENLERCPTWLNLNFRDVEVLSTSRKQRAVELVNTARLAVLIAAPVGCQDSPILTRYKDHFSVIQRPMMKTTSWGRICGFENTSMDEIRALVRGVHRVFHTRLTRMVNPLYFFSLGLESTNPYISTFLWVSGLDSLLMAATRKQFCDRLVNVFGEKTFILPRCDPGGQPNYQVGAMVDDLYTFRSVIAHGQLIPKNLLAQCFFTNDRAKVIDSYPSPTTVVDVLRECALFLFTRMLKLILADGYLKTFENIKNWRLKLDHPI